MYDFTRMPWELETDYDAAIPFAIDSFPQDSPALNELVAQIFKSADIVSLIAAKQPTRFRSAYIRMEKCLTSLIWHLYKAARAGQDFYVKASFKHAAFSPPSEFNPKGITRKWIEVAKLLKKHGLLEIFRGFYCRKTFRGKFTRLRATPKLYDELVALPPDIREDAEARPNIVIRHRETKKLSSLSEYSDHPRVCPSSYKLGHKVGLSYGGSGSSVGLIMQPAFDVASVDTRLSVS